VHDVNDSFMSSDDMNESFTSSSEPTAEHFQGDGPAGLVAYVASGSIGGRSPGLSGSGCLAWPAR